MKWAHVVRLRLTVDPSVAVGDYNQWSTHGVTGGATFSFRGK